MKGGRIPREVWKGDVRRRKIGENIKVEQGKNYVELCVAATTQTQIYV